LVLSSLSGAIPSSQRTNIWNQPVDII
jgi:hypothetical protein